MSAFPRLTACLALTLLFTLQAAAYTLKDDYSGANFFSMFDFFTEDDPTHGYVDYVAQSEAKSAGLINSEGGQIYMGVDSTNVASGRGRKSVRVTSKAQYNHALIVLDLEHMPGSICSVWPAFWTVGPNWPNNGEIDIIEGVNTQSHNAMTLHTGPGCSIGSSRPPNRRAVDASALFSGSVATSNCDVNAAGQSTNAGCSIGTSDTASYGDGLNKIQGGVYATEWTSDVIRMWFFPRGSIPSDIDNSPDPSSWGTPLAAFQSTSCDIDSAFKNQQIVFDTTFCGDWAGQVWSTDPVCSKKAPTCNDFAKNNPEAFTEAYWTINSLKVFTGGASGNNTVPSAGRPGNSAIPTASRLPIGTGINSGKPSVVPTGGISKPSANPTGDISVPPSNPPVSSSGFGGKPNTPTTTLSTATTPFSQQAPDQNSPWGGRTRTWSWDNNGERGRWRDGRSVAEQTPAPALASQPQPPVEIDEFPTDAELRRTRRHLLKHKRHGGGLLT